ncbi:MAG: methyltransferase domain-containing protein, partial [Muribaculaceae bacterium]|nr:methyltransferase domain-containing protein [Muribaculaceae bacterium]
CHTPSGRFDVIASASTIQWFNSPRRFISECHRILRPGGLLILTAFVRGNMHELTTAGASTLNLPDERRWRAMIPSGFDILSWATADYDLAFPEPVDVLRHLRLSGVNGLDRSSRTTAGPSIIHRYPCRLDGQCHLTYRTIRMILKKQENV